MPLALFLAHQSAYLFKNVDFSIGAWHLNTTNFIGIFMAIVIMFYSVAVYFGVSDLSKEFDLKQRMAEDSFIEASQLKSGKQCITGSPNRRRQ